MGKTRETGSNPVPSEEIQSAMTHFKAVTKKPELAQTPPLQLKTDFFLNMWEFALEFFTRKQLHL